MPFFISKIEREGVLYEKIIPQGVEKMRFAKFRLALLLPPGEIITKKFSQAKKDYEDRKSNFNGLSGVVMNRDKTLITLPISNIRDVLNSGKKFIVARFGCEDESQGFAGLTVAICAMNQNEVDNNTPLFTEGLLIDTPDEILNWRKKENNYRVRRSKLITGDSNEFKNDFPHGIAHEIDEFRKEWFSIAENNGMTEVAIYFIKFGGVGTVAYADARITEDTLSSNFEVYDFGGACCPPA